MIHKMAKSLLITPGPTHAHDPAVHIKAMLQRCHESNMDEQSKRFNTKL